MTSRLGQRGRAGSRDGHRPEAEPTLARYLGKTATSPARRRYGSGGIGRGPTVQVAGPSPPGRGVSSRFARAAYRRRCWGFIRFG